MRRLKLFWRGFRLTLANLLAGGEVSVEELNYLRQMLRHERASAANWRSMYYRETQQKVHSGASSTITVTQAGNLQQLQQNPGQFVWGDNYVEQRFQAFYGAGLGQVAGGGFAVDPADGDR